MHIICVLYLCMDAYHMCYSHAHKHEYTMCVSCVHANIYVHCMHLIYKCIYTLCIFHIHLNIHVHQMHLSYTHKHVHTSHRPPYTCKHICISCVSHM